MIGAVHACIGACVGSFFKNKECAAAAGVVSHAIADMIPHKDLDPKIEVPLLIGALIAIANVDGVDSTEFWGALGAVSPDIEHGLCVAGLIKEDQKIFPTHINGGIYHGGDSGERWSQLAIAAASIVTAAIRSDKS